MSSSVEIDVSTQDNSTQEVPPSRDDAQAMVERLNKAIEETLPTLQTKKSAENLRHTCTSSCTNLCLTRSVNAITTHVHWTSPENDTTFPETLEANTAYVQRLRDAIVDTSSCLDSADSLYRKRFEDGNAPWTSRNVVVQAWSMLFAVRSIHKKGFTAPIMDSDMLETISQTRDWTFEERVDTICRVARLSKFVANGIMKDSAPWVVVGAPHYLYQLAIEYHKAEMKSKGWLEAEDNDDEVSALQVMDPLEADAAGVGAASS